jgi:hypothetical protein
MLRFIGRLILIPLGILVAALVVLVFLGFVAVVQPAVAGVLSETVLKVFENAWYAVNDGEEGIRKYAASLMGFSLFPVVVLFLPVTVVAAIAEVFGIRSWFLQALVGALLTALLPWAMYPEIIAGKAMASPATGLLAVAGALGGTIYWMIAGHSAGSPPRTIEERATIKAPVRKP